MNAKIEKTKHSLMNALSRLIETTDLDKITVSQLCKEAGINRTTFYKYYAVPSDVLLECTERIFQQVIYSDDSPKKTLYDYMLSICRIVYHNRNLMEVFIRADGNLMKLFHGVLIQHSGTLGYMSDPVNTFISGGIGSTVMSWTLRGFAEPPETVALQMAECISRLMPETK